MRDIGVDFGLFIAYLVPGTLAVWGISYLYPNLRSLYDLANAKDGGAAALAALTLLAVIIGMLVSIVRAALIDRSFTIDLHRALPATKVLDYFREVHRVDPVYSRLASKERLAAYMEAKSSDKRPYQFYGNTLIAAVIFAFGYFTNAPDTQGFAWFDYLIGLFILLIVCTFLYAAARQSYARFMAAVTDLNSLGASNAP